MDTNESDAPVNNVAAEAERKRRMELAAKRRARIMAQMSKMQRDFIKENAELFQSTSTDLQPSGSDMDIRYVSPKYSVPVLRILHVYCQSPHSVSIMGDRINTDSSNPWILEIYQLTWIWNFLYPSLILLYVRIVGF